MKALHSVIIAILASVALIVLPYSVQAQTQEVRQVIDSFFEGMRLGDSSMIRRTFTDDVILATVFKNKQGEPVLEKEESILPFLKSIGTPHDQPYNEPIWDVVIQIDGNLAHVWCNYAFYLGNTFHHCGVDSFMLFNGKNGWKIFHLTDTRRREDCQVPEEVKNKFSK